MMRFLLLEDDDFDALLVERELRASGLEIEISRASDRPGYEALLAESFDLVLSDYNIPGLSKGASLELAQRDLPGVPFILLSGALPEEAVADFLKAGVTDFVNKDRMERLPIAVRRALEEAERGRALERANAELVRAKEAAEQANLAKDRFIATLSHELRTPLTPVLLSLELALMDDSLSPELAGILTTMRRNLQLEVQLINDLLDLTAISKGKLEFRVEETDFVALVLSAVQICQPEANEKDLTLEAAFDRAALPVRADARRTQQAIWNLVRNAIKFSSPGHRVTLSLSHADGWLRFDVRDQGVGIAPANLVRIFSPFDQVDGQKRGGLGLGLAIAKEIVEAMGGRLYASSEGEGTGATFTIEMPLIDTVERPSDEPTLHDPQGIRRHGVRVLVVEDNLDTAQAVCELLRLEGFDVEAASSVDEARRTLDRAEFEVLVSDIGLPDGTGYDLRRGIAPGRLRSIALTGYGQEADVERALASGFDEQLTKPVDIRVLLRRIDALLAAGRA